VIHLIQEYGTSYTLLRIALYHEPAYFSVEVVVFNRYAVNTNYCGEELPEGSQSAIPVIWLSM
jgi:hypothetical protein